MPLDRVPGTPFRITVDQDADRRRPSWFAIRPFSFVLILLSIALALGPLADGSQVDPVWIGGIYGADDDDDAVRSFVSPGTVLEGARPQDFEPVLVVVGHSGARATTPSAVTALQAFRLRSPPIP